MNRHTTNLLLMGSLLTCCIEHATFAGPIENAVEAYQSAMQSSVRDERINGFGRAELLFRKAIDDANGTANAELYGNLGTTCLSAERIGPAIVAFRKAILIDPTHAHSRKNLAHARQLLPEWARPQIDVSLLGQIRSSASRRSLITLGAVCFLATCLMFAAAIQWRSGFLKMLTMFPFATWLVLTVMFFVTKSDAIEAVVVRDDVVARSADSHNSSERFIAPLPSGAEVIVLDERDEWLQISLDDKRAWVPRSTVEFVSLP